MDSSLPNIVEIHQMLLALQKNLECPICLEVMKEPVSTNCAHIFCRFCMLKLIGQKKGVAQCPLCSAKVTKRSLWEDVRFKQVIKMVLEIIHAFECDTGFKFSDNQCFPKKGTDVTPSSEPQKEQTVVDCKGYKDRLKRVKENKKGKSNLRKSPSLPTVTGIVKRYSLRKKSNSDKAIAFEIGSDSSEDAVKKADEVKWTIYSSQDREESVKNQHPSPAHMEFPCPSAEDGTSLDILGSCGFLGKGPESTEDILPSPERFDAAVDESHNASVLGPSMEQHNGKHVSSVLGKDGSCTLFDMAQMMGEATESSLAKQAGGNVEKTSNDTDVVLASGSTPVCSALCRDDEQLVQSQTSAEESLHQVSGKKLRRSIQKVREWLSKSKEVLTSGPQEDLCAEEVHRTLDDPYLSDAESRTSEKIEQVESRVECTVGCEADRFFVKPAASNIEDKIFGRTYKRERKSTPLQNRKETILAQAEEGITLNPEPRDTHIRKKLTRKRKAASELAGEALAGKQNVEEFVKRPGEDKNIALEESSQVAVSVDDSFVADQKEPELPVECSIKESFSILESDADESSPPAHHKLSKNRFSLSKRTRQLIKPASAMRQETDRNPLSPQNTKMETGNDVVREAGTGQEQVRRSRRLQLQTEEIRRKSEPTKRGRKQVEERENKRRWSHAGNMPSPSIAENSPNLLLREQQKDTFVPDASVIDTEDNADKTSVNPTTSPHVRGISNGFQSAEKAIEESSSSCIVVSANSQDSCSLLRLNPSELKQVTSEHKQFISACQSQERGLCVNISGGNELCTSNMLEICRSSKTIEDTSGSLELNTEPDDGELDTNFVQKIFSGCKRQSFLLHPRPVKESTTEVQKDESVGCVGGGKVDSLQQLTQDTDKACKERGEVIACELNECSYVHRLRSSSLLEHEGRNEQVALQAPFPDPPSTPVLSATKSAKDRHRQQHQPVTEEKAFPEKGNSANPNPPGGTRSAWTNGTVQDPSFDIIKDKSSNTGDYLQKTAAETVEDKDLVLNTPLESIQLHSESCKTQSPEFICDHSKKESTTDQKQENDAVVEATGHSSASFPKCLLPAEDLARCTEEESHGSEASETPEGLSSETPEGLVGPAIRSEKNLPKYKGMDRKETLVVSSGTDEHPLSGEDSDKSSGLVLKHKCLPHQRRVQKLSSSDDDSSEDEELPSFQALIFGKLANTGSSEKEAGASAEILAVKSNSTSNLKPKNKAISPSQESQCSVNLFSSPSHTSEDSRFFTPGPASKEKLAELSENEEAAQPKDRDAGQSKDELQESENAESSSDEDAMDKDSDLVNSSGLSSQSEILTTQQRDAMQNNLKKLQHKMAILEAVLNQGSQGAASEDFPLLEDHLNRGPTGSKEITRMPPAAAQDSRTPSSARHTAQELPASPLYSAKKGNLNSLLLTRKKNISLVASGLNQGELRLVQKFARKTNSTWSDKITEETTHVIMKTDEDLVCERTLKYFLGIAGQKWVVGYQWIVRSLKEGRVLNEADFEVRGDITNGRNHQGPQRARESSEKLFQGLEICCCGPFTDMLQEQLEWMLELCGGTLVKQPHLFTHPTDSATSVVVIQPEVWNEDTACQEIPLQCGATVVSREWVLDSVACYRRQAFAEYIVQQM